jgi:D-sedoheptulose 7-phosphate isomerase
MLDVQAAIAAHHEAIGQVAAMEDDLRQAASKLEDTFRLGGSVFACGNGGSAADAQHFAAELTGRYQMDRPGYPAVALTTDSSALTSIGNDYGFEHIYARQLQALSRPGDLLIAISTSGNSTNVVKAVEYAKANGIYTIGLLGRDGGTLAAQVDLALTIAVESTARIQEAHIVILHLLCEAFEESAED